MCGLFVIKFRLSFHVHHIHTFIHCKRVVTENPEVKSEGPSEETTQEVIQGFDICGTDPDPTLYAIQGKPRCIQPLLVI